MSLYAVDFTIEGCFQIEVDINDVGLTSEQAKAKAARAGWNAYHNGDFETKEVEWDATYAEASKVESEEPK